MSDIRALNEAAVRHSMDIVGRVTPDDLGRATPCAAWTLADLLGHMTVQHRGFAAAAAGDGADLAHWRFEPAGDDAVERYLQASEQVIAAFAVAGEEFTLPEFGDPAPSYPAHVAMSFHFIDYVVHAWDVARAIDVEYVLAPELADPALRIALNVPNAERRLRPGAAFVPALETSAGDADSGSALDRVLLWLGRDPEWPAQGSE
jgi:uncharacterized protein (TIGR03086 family)